MIEPIDELFLGMLMCFVGLFGFMIISDFVKNGSHLRWWWLGVWCVPPIFKLWFSAVIAFFL